MPQKETTQPPPVPAPKSRARRAARRLMIHFLLIVLGFYIVLCVSACAFQKRLTYFPSKEVAFTPANFGFECEEVFFLSGETDSEDAKAEKSKRAPPARICAWYVPARPERGVLLFCHGNAGNISDRLDSIEIFHELGLSVFIFDYRGYGKSAGSPSEKGLYADAEAAWDYLIRQRGVAPGRIVIFGRSLGGGVASYLAAETTGGGAPDGGTGAGPGALILESTFTSLPDLGAALYPYLPVRWMAREHYNTRERMARIACPVLVAHSPQDEIIPYDQGRAVFAAAREPKVFLQLRGGHNEGFLSMGQSYTRALDAFLREFFDEKQPPE